MPNGKKSSFLLETPYREVLRRLLVWEIIFAIVLIDAIALKLVFAI